MKLFLLLTLLIGLASAASLRNYMKEELIRALEEKFLEEEEKDRKALLEKEAKEKRTHEHEDGIPSLYALEKELLRALDERQSTDGINVAESYGSDVVTASVQAIAESEIFPTDREFLRRIAWVESKYGRDQNTYREGYYGGIWQVDKSGFEDTQKTGSHRGLLSKFDKIKEHFDINWATVKWEDLRKPLYSALAARLFLSNIPSAIPSSLEEQAEYWKEYYNKNGEGTVQKFINDVEALENK